MSSALHRIQEPNYFSRDLDLLLQQMYWRQAEPIDAKNTRSRWPEPAWNFPSLPPACSVLWKCLAFGLQADLSLQLRVVPTTAGRINYPNPYVYTASNRCRGIPDLFGVVPLCTTGLDRALDRGSGAGSLPATQIPHTPEEKLPAVCLLTNFLGKFAST